MEMLIEIMRPGGVPVAAIQLLESFPDKKIFAFYGEMGVGKTTLITAICKELGVTDGISSPTFSLVNEYTSAKGEKIFHFDFYRIKSISEAYDMGYEDYFYADAYCFIEWPEKIEELLPENCIKIKMSKKGEARVLLME